MKKLMQSAFAIVFFSMISPFGLANAADQWSVRRATMSGACHVGKEPQEPRLGTILSTKPDRKGACLDAQSRKASSDDDAGDTQKCQGYTTGAVNTCKTEGIDLNKP